MSSELLTKHKIKFTKAAGSHLISEKFKKVHTSYGSKNTECETRYCTSVEKNAYRWKPLKTSKVLLFRPKTFGPLFFNSKLCKEANTFLFSCRVVDSLGEPITAPSKFLGRANLP